jgi:hypothetical protein
MRVTENCGNYCGGIVMKRPIALRHFLAMPLKETTFHENALAVHLDEELRPGRRAGSPEKLDAHARENGRPR